MIIMINDQRICYFTLDLPANPVVDGTTWKSPPAGNSTVSWHDPSILTDEVNAILHRAGLEPEVVFLWAWNKRNDGRDTYDIHSDGIYQNPDQQRCALNWLMEGESSVEWWSVNGGTPEVTHKDDRYFCFTRWRWIDSTPSRLAEWNGKNPAMVSIKQPHSVRVLPSSTSARRSVSIRFKSNPTMESALIRLSSRVVSVNR